VTAGGEATAPLDEDPPGPAPAARSAPSAVARRSAVDVQSLVEAAAAGDRRALARLLSFVEQGGDAARRVSRLTFSKSGGTYTVGITGAPGSGKSSLTNRLVGELRTGRHLPVAVVAIDPSSPFSGGAILGDRVRMQDHALDGGVFIRSMATRGHLGGLALAVPEAIRLLDATGWPVVLVETVGVGQVEVEVAGACDTTVVVLNPGWGDSVQANKAGLLEVADVFVINKADRPGVREARRDLKQMLQMSDTTDWCPPIVETVATAGEGTSALWEAVESHRAHLEETGQLDRRRRERLEAELRRILGGRLDQALRDLFAAGAYDQLHAALLEHLADPQDVADQLLEGVARRLSARGGYGSEP
jgi:LAO/AO transport system kinase